MSKNYYLPRADEEKATWLNNFAAKLTFFASKYGITPEEVADVQNSARLFEAILQYKNQLNAHLGAVVGFKNLVRDDVKGNTTLEIPVQPMPMFPGPIVPGIFVRCTAIANRIKSHINYNTADGTELGIEGTKTTIDLKDLKPVILIRLVNGGRPEIVWKKQGMDGIEIHKEDAHGDWQLLAFDSSPNYVDLSPLPPKGTSIVWRYRVIYLRKDQRLGQWSDVVSITVTG